MDIGESIPNDEGSLKVTLIDFDPVRGKGHIKIDDVHSEKRDYIVVVKFASGGDHRIKHEPRNPRYTPTAEISSMARGDQITGIEFISFGGVQGA
jgi:hypothetical protein